MNMIKITEDSPRHKIAATPEPRNKTLNRGGAS